MLNKKQHELITEAAKATGGLSAQLTIARIYLTSSGAQGMCIDTVFECLTKAEEYVKTLDERRGDLFTADLEERRGA